MSEKRTKRRRLLALGAILLGLIALTKVGGRLYDERQQRAQVAAVLKEHGLKAIPGTATGQDVKIDCSWLFCSIEIGFADEPLNIARWVTGSAALASRPKNEAKSGAFSYELASEPRHRSTVRVDENAGKVTASFMLRTCPYCEGRGD